MATSSSRKTASAADRRKAAAHPAWIKKLFDREGWNLSLPHCVFDTKGRCVLANFRMAELLGFRRMPEFPLAAKEFSERWPFFNAKKSSVALASSVSKGEIPDSLMVEAGLKTFRLSMREEKVSGQTLRVLVAESVRKGDLLADRAAKETLFLSLSHEIRTAVTALRGYLEMGTDDLVRERMKHAVSRLENVVKRLDDFKKGLDDG